MRSKSIAIQVIVADAHIAVTKYGYPLTEARLQIGIPIDVDQFDIKTVGLVHCLERQNHLCAQVAVGAPVDREANRVRLRLFAHSIRSGM